MSVPHCPLPVEEMTVALYLQSVVERANTFATVKSASTAIAYFQKINLQHHLPRRYIGDGEASSFAQVQADAEGKKGGFPMGLGRGLRPGIRGSQPGLLPPCRGINGRGGARGHVQI